MTARVLPPADWPRLAETDLREWALLPTSAVTVVVVEDVDGAIVAHVALFSAAHAEKAWVAPAHRQRGVVFGALVDALRQTARAEFGTAAVVAGAASETMRTLLDKLGATRLPGDYYSLPTRGA
jgi:hypothetical protein